MATARLCDRGLLLQVAVRNHLGVHGTPTQAKPQGQVQGRHRGSVSHTTRAIVSGGLPLTESACGITSLPEFCHSCRGEGNARALGNVKSHIDAFRDARLK
jgi:hypothetical protein